MKNKKSFISIFCLHDLKNHDVYRSFSIFSSDAFKNFLPLGCFPPSLFAAQKILFPPSMHATIAPSQHSRPFHPFPEKSRSLSLKASFLPTQLFFGPLQSGAVSQKGFFLSSKHIWNPVRPNLFHLHDTAEMLAPKYTLSPLLYGMQKGLAYLCFAVPTNT